MKTIITFVNFALVSIVMASPVAAVKVTGAEFGAKWPFTVDEGVIGYEPVRMGDKNFPILTFESGGKTYALNGLAKGRSEKRGYLDIVEIWKDDPKIPGVKMDISPITKRGLELAEE
jgi:hypothetical protein